MLFARTKVFAFFLRSYPPFFFVKISENNVQAKTMTNANVCNAICYGLFMFAIRILGTTPKEVVL